MLRAAIAVIILAVLPPIGCHGLIAPDPSTVVRRFEPVGRWAGHWGVDITSPIGSGVTTIGEGTVSFSGRVVTNTTVTIDHGGGVRSSYSYLATIRVGTGDVVRASQVIGNSAVHDGREAFHLSLRHADTYIDPMALHRCTSFPTGALWLSTDTDTYAPARARSLRRYLRSTPHGAPRRRERRARSTPDHERAVHPCR